MQVYRVEVTIPADKTRDSFEAKRIFNVSKTMSDSFFRELNKKGYRWVATNIIVYENSAQLDAGLAAFERMSDMVVGAY